MDIPYWLDEPSEPVPLRPLDRAPEVEVVGGGITGCSCATALAAGGVRVRLYEAREIATGASGRNGGFALRGGAMAYHHARKWLGADRAREYWRWTETYLDRMEELGGEAFRRTGSLRLAADEEERDELRAEFEALEEDGFEAEWIDRPGGALAGKFPAAMLHPPDAVLQPAHLVKRRAQMLSTEPLPELLYERPHYGRQGFDYWHQRRDGTLLVGGFRDISLDSEFTDEEETTKPIQ